MSIKEDLTKHGDQELSLRVYNESIYDMRFDKLLFEYLDELYIYTDAQKQELLDDLEDEQNEYMDKNYE